MDMPRVLHGDACARLVARLCEIAAADPVAAQLADTLLAPLVREDRERRSNLVQTLAAYYACAGRVDKTAERLFLHRNSVRYRLDRIRILLRLDIDQPHVMAALLAATAMHERAEARHAG